MCGTVRRVPAEVTPPTSDGSPHMYHCIEHDLAPDGLLARSLAQYPPSASASFGEVPWRPTSTDVTFCDGSARSRMPTPAATPRGRADGGKVIMPALPISMIGAGSLCQIMSGGRQGRSSGSRALSCISTWSAVRACCSSSTFWGCRCSRSASRSRTRQRGGSMSLTPGAMPATISESTAGSPAMASAIGNPRSLSCSVPLPSQPCVGHTHLYPHRTSCWAVVRGVQQGAEQAPCPGLTGPLGASARCQGSQPCAGYRSRARDPRITRDLQWHQQNRGCP